MATTCIIGDIHGCLSPLEELLALVEGLADTFVFLGDYIDRGPDSKAVINRILEFQKVRPQTVTLMGNHEMMLLDYLQGHDEEYFLNAGGRDTLASYGISPDIGPKAVKALLPQEHLDFFSSLPFIWEDRHGIYVHAGLEPGVETFHQVAACCVWIRDEFVRSRYPFEKTVVFGHTVFREPKVEKYKIGIDTGAVYGGELTALLLPQREFVSVTGEKKSNMPAGAADLDDLVQGRTISRGLGKLLRFFRR
jgi:serine/threonine protein phosphatase 1